MDVFMSDFDSYSESSSCSDDQEDDEFMYGGQASCILSNLDESIEKIDDFLLFERRYVHGDIVFSVNDPYGQMGRVINVETIVDLENIYEKKLKGIDSKKLGKIRSISAGDYVVTGPWVGKADQITDSVTVLFDDGTKCEFTITGMENLVPVSPDLVDDSQYYPGQRVKLVNSSVSNSTRWFCGSRNEKQTEGTVSSVKAGLVHVNWLGCVLFGPEGGSEGAPVPPCLQSPKDLTLVSSFPNWQLGDWCVLPKTEQTGFQEIFVISKTKSKIDVLWQDGTESYGLDSGSLGPVNSLDAHDFWPHQFVLEKGSSDDRVNTKWGVVKSVDPKEKIVNVKWEANADVATVSAYELIDHPDYSYTQGDLVFRLNIKPPDEHFRDFYLSHVGIVIGFRDGFVDVKWVTGFTSKVAPHEIFRVEKSEGVSATPLLNDSNIEPNQEKTEHDNHTTDSDDDDDEKDCLKTLYDSSTFNVPRAAIGFLSGVATHLFGFLDYASLPVSSRLGSGLEEDTIETYTDPKLEKTEESEEVSVSVSSTIKNPKEFEQFEMVSDCSNHHFVDNPGNRSISTQVKRSWLKKVQQEWRILANDLPETIYVRVFEERMDLLHAAIIGAPGTPYHDAIFFFDIFLPPEYPHEPLMVHYESGGLRVNPNLYESGRVCLSLLNTWSGTGSETWNPNGSTVLQVLVSLQALVLNKKPYFNEAGYEHHVGSVEGEKNSCSYNENTFLMSCKSMLYVLHKPPKHFETLVEEHFRKHCVCILMACKAYLEGVPIGYAFESEDPSPEGQKGNSTGFKIMLSKLVPKLVEAFIAKGFDCGEYSEMGNYNTL